jgi:broad specificity phosphatase PhoE
MSEILFIRHAETDLAGTFCGHSDPDLNARGHTQVSALIERLRGEDIGALYTSDLRRAQTTARAISKSFAIDCIVRPALREINFGRWEGRTWNDIERYEQDYAHRWLAEYPNLPAPGGEDVVEFEKRVLNEMEFLSTRVMARNIVVVTHAGILRTVLCALSGCSTEEAWKQTKPYCSIVRYSVAAWPSTQLAEVLQ